VVVLGGKIQLKNMKPYTETNNGNIIRRTFSDNIPESELVWHRDHEDRVVLPLNENDWMVQFDNELPTKLTVGEEYFIPKDTFHRVIKGSGELQVEIIKTDFDEVIEEGEKWGKKSTSEGLNMSENFSIFDKKHIKMKLHETFNHEEPLVMPAGPKTKPKESPMIQPSRRNKPFLPERETQPDPKAEN
jgi:hypothetical protein